MSFGRFLGRMFDPMGQEMYFNAQQAELERNFNAQQAQQAQAFSAQQAQNQMDFQERMSNTAYQRQVEDMRRAGLNPYLAYSAGGSSTPTGASGSAYTASSGSARTSGSHKSIFEQMFDLSKSALALASKLV